MYVYSCHSHNSGSISFSIFRFIQKYFGFGGWTKKNNNNKRKSLEYENCTRQIFVLRVLLNVFVYFIVAFVYELPPLLKRAIRASQKKKLKSKLISIQTINDSIDFPRKCLFFYNITFICYFYFVLFHFFCFAFICLFLLPFHVVIPRNFNYFSPTTSSFS